jgi:hypothetical protein
VNKDVNDILNSTNSSKKYNKDKQCLFQIEAVYENIQGERKMSNEPNDPTK